MDITRLQTVFPALRGCQSFTAFFSSSATRSLIFFFLLVNSIVANAQVRLNDDDVANANVFSRKYKDDDVICTSSHHLFTFDKGKNALNDKVVVIEEEAEIEFLSLKKYASVTYPEFYNRFIEIKNFKKALKVGNKYAVSRMPAMDRSVTSEGVFFDDSRVQYYPIRFSDKGSMARINVRKEYTDGRYLTRLFFAENYPVKEQVYEFKVPEWLTVDFKAINFDGNKIEKQENKKGGYVTYVFTMHDIPADKQEYRSIGHAYTDPHIVIQIKSFESKGETLKGFDKTDDVYAWNNRLYGMAGNKKEPLQPVLAKITEGKKTDIDKIKAIYYWVQDNIRYIAYEDGYSGYIPASAQDVLSKKFGDCKGMANLLTEFLTMAGYDAHFTWIGTRSIPYQQSMPALCVNNHAITTLYFQGKEYFLDGTEKYAPFGENAYRIQGKEAMIAKGDKYDLKTVPLTTGNDHKIFSKADFTLANDVLSGKIKVVLTGNERTDFHQAYQDLPISAQKDFLNDYLEFGNDNMQATNVKTSDLKNRETPVTIEGNVDLSNYVSNISGDKYISIDFFPKTLERFMPDEKRVGGYDFDDVLTFEDEISLTVPAGYKFVDIPEKASMEYDGYAFKGEYTVTGNTIVLRKKILIKNSMIKKADFENWKKFLGSIKEFSKYLLSVTNK
ncbi:MAG: transglutaminase-like domain-containing protein [Chitinophagaceae bacterium]